MKIGVPNYANEGHVMKYTRIFSPTYVCTHDGQVYEQTSGWPPDSNAACNAQGPCDKDSDLYDTI